MSLIKSFLAGKVQFRVQGLPLWCLNKLRTFHITQISVAGDTTNFVASLAHSNAIKKLISNFEYQATENYNLFRGVNFLLNHMILVVSILVAVCAYFIADWRIYTVRVQCDDESIIPAVYEHLSQIGVGKFTLKNKLQQFDLASDLVSNFENIAHAHVRVAGNTLVVDLVTATHQNAKVKTNIYAQYDAVIKEITVYSGTALVTVGDVVKKGDLLVADAYPDSVVVTGEVAFVHGKQISRLVIWII